MSPTNVARMDSPQPEDRYGEFTAQDAENKKDVTELLDKMQKKDVAWTTEDDRKLDSLKRRCPDYFDDNEDVSTEERLVTMEEDLEKEETEARRRQLWRDTHPPIPETDWNQTTSSNDANNPSQSTSVSSDANNPSQSTSVISDPQDSSPEVPVNNAATTTSGSTEPSPRRESPVDFVVDKMESEMPNYTDPEDV